MVEYKIKPRLFGNPDRLQDPTKPLNIGVKTITASNLTDLKAKVHEWLMDNQIGAGNWGDTPVYKNLKDRKSTRLNSSHIPLSRMPSSA